MPDLQPRERTVRWTLFIAYALTIPAANWMINHVGTEAFPGGPHTIPVGFGYQAPSGVLMIGAALVLRDEHRQDGALVPPARD